MVQVPTKRMPRKGKKTQPYKALINALEGLTKALCKCPIHKSIDLRPASCQQQLTRGLTKVAAPLDMFGTVWGLLVFGCRS